MIVYRIEHSVVRDAETDHYCGPLAEPDRFGKWRDDVRDAQDYVCQVMNGRMDKPTPFWDLSLNGICENEVCGVVSMEALSFWFEWSISALLKAGFVINRYEVDPPWVRVGESGQVVFNPDHATLLHDNDRETVK